MCSVKICLNISKTVVYILAKVCIFACFYSASNKASLFLIIWMKFKLWYLLCFCCNNFTFLKEINKGSKNHRFKILPVRNIYFIVFTTFVLYFNNAIHKDSWEAYVFIITDYYRYFRLHKICTIFCKNSFYRSKQIYFENWKKKHTWWPSLMD